MIIPAPFDAHVHFRQGEMLKNVVKYHDEVFEYALVMPNTIPPVVTFADARFYRHEIRATTNHVQALMTLKLLPRGIPDFANSKTPDVVACKLYPQGLTTNSDDGFSLADLENCRETLYPALEEMQKHDLVLCVHGETPGVFCIDREANFLPIIWDIADNFPKLRIVMEHITTSEAVEMVRNLKNVAATITLHHLMLTLDDVVGDKLQPHNFCKPIAKTPADRKALLQVVSDRHERFFLGSDSAPHAINAKECDHGCAGIFSAPVLMPALATTLPDAETLADFTSNFGRRWYRLPEATWKLEAYRHDWKVPDLIPGNGYGCIVPFMAVQTIPYSVRRVS